MANEKVVIVAAGGSGMGAAAARRIAPDGFRIPILSLPGTGEEIAATVAFLVSEGAGHVTCQNNLVDCGLMRSI